VYYFTWKTPVYEGKLKAFHTLEIAFALARVDESKSMTGSGADRYPLQDKLSCAWQLSRAPVIRITRACQTGRFQDRSARHHDLR
jgi:hypothetical protein